MDDVYKLTDQLTSFKQEDVSASPALFWAQVATDIAKALRDTNIPAIRVASPQFMPLLKRNGNMSAVLSPDVMNLYGDASSLNKQRIH
jgi:hypothetical protein